MSMMYSFQKETTTESSKQYNHPPLVSFKNKEKQKNLQILKCSKVSKLAGDLSSFYLLYIFSKTTHSHRANEIWIQPKKINVIRNTYKISKQSSLPISAGLKKTTATSLKSIFHVSILLRAFLSALEVSKMKRPLNSIILKDTEVVKNNDNNEHDLVWIPSWKWIRKTE
ncbi:hypothetical protein Cgig2_021990 [Carnegiea gigantea]|uniref:Uncharacterized protein n=1 Tax=Carnegiea gigantea TaxID=171969 RepID=A0A9Q1QN46_9CARY|nr:hypothetical protein Cgig2_021990 [Carnegiea gigantea]